jgi:RNA polymerase sigma factor (sigma-70 family)
MIAITADKAYEKLVSSNLRLVLAVVRRYTKTKVPLAELIAEGTRGLSKAVRRYDFERGFRFATYATWYVTQAVADAARFSTTPAKIPSKYITLRRSLKKFIPQYQEENSRNPTLQEICEALGTCELYVVKCLNIQNAAISLNEVIGKSGDSKGDRTFEEILQSESGLNPDLQSRQNQLNRDINVALEKNLEKEEKDKEVKKNKYDNDDSYNYRGSSKVKRYSSPDNFVVDALTFPFKALSSLTKGGLKSVTSKKVDDEETGKPFELPGGLKSVTSKKVDEEIERIKRLLK